MSARWQLSARARTLGQIALEYLRRGLDGVAAVVEVRGRGLMIGIECARPETAHAATARLLEQGYVILPSGDGGRVLSLTPPLMIGQEALLTACDAIIDRLASVSAIPEAIPEAER